MCPKALEGAVEARKAPIALNGKEGHGHGLLHYYFTCTAETSLLPPPPALPAALLDANWMPELRRRDIPLV